MGAPTLGGVDGGTPDASTPENDPPFVMDAREMASGMVLGTDRSVSVLAASAVPPLTALSAVLLDALHHPPCVVAFSGGRDSSTLLAAAVDLARREGLALPIPATNRFPGMADVDEDRWQEMVVRHLGLDDWLRFDHSDELDVLGPIAGPIIRRYGTIWPVNAHFVVPLLQALPGGCLITGTGGDEIFTPGVHRVALVLSAAARPHRSDISAVASRLAPRPWRIRVEQQAFEPSPWLRPAAVDALRPDLARWLVDEPLWWGASIVDWWWRSRGRRGVEASLAALAAENATVIVHPFMNGPFLAAVAGDRWRIGYRSRTAAMRILFGELLPDAVLSRETKAAFYQPFIHRYSRAFIDQWDGSGIDPQLVDPVILHRTWREADVDARSYSLLQSAWLATT